MHLSLPLRLAAIVVLGASVIHCGAPASDTSPTSDDDQTSEEATEHVGSQSQATFVLPPRCYGKMLQVAPFDQVDQPVGKAMTVRINRVCDRGAALVARKVRVYVRRFEVGQSPGPQILLKDWTDVTADQYRLDVPWTAGTVADSTVLPPGRYQIYTYSLNASLYGDWVSGDSFARNMSTRSDNTYVTLKAPGTWTPDPWDACSVTCGGGTQSRTNKCKDGSNVDIDSRYCIAAPPATSQACNTSACGPTPEELCTNSGGTWDGSSCITPPPPDPAMDCQMMGGSWNGSYCDFGMPFFDPMMDCMISGGMWMGGYCDYSFNYGIPGG